MTRVRRFYGAQPLHLLATIVSFALVAAGVAGWFQAGSDPRGILLWVLGSAVAFEWILLPLAWVLDRIALGAPLGERHTRPRLGPRNRAYVRAPTLLSALLLIVSAPLIFRADTPDFERLIELALATARGLALLDTLHPGGQRNREQWPFCRARLVELFEAAAAR